MSEELLTRARCEQILTIVTALARSKGVSDVEVMIGAAANALTRFANNTIHQNVAERGNHVSVRALIDSRTARANTNRFEDGLVAKEAIDITRLLTPDPELLPLAEQRAISRL